MSAAREVYHGRRLVVKKSQTSGYLEVSVNGQLISKPIASATRENLARELECLRRTVDDADARPGAYGEYFYQGSTR